jgi:2'-5' RNA ligase
MKEIEQWRVFVAIELPATARKGLIEHIDRLRETIPEARASWSREENLHLTLKFLGDIPVANVESLSHAVEQAALSTRPFELIIADCGAFPERDRPRVLWIGIEDPSGKLAQLHQALENECAARGFEREQRGFHPHLTIARLRKPQGSRRLADLHKEIGFRPIPAGVSELCVLRSELHSEGSKHTVISRHEFS